MKKGGAVWVNPFVDIGTMWLIGAKALDPYTLSIGANCTRRR